MDLIFINFLWDFIKDIILGEKLFYGENMKNRIMNAYL